MDDADSPGRTALDIDADLPNLSLVLDLAGVAELFSTSWAAADGPEGRSPAARDRSDGPPIVEARRLMDAKYEPSRRCVAVYELVVARGETVRDATIGVLEITPRGTSVRPFADDPQLPWLRDLVDPRYMCERVRAVLGDPVEDCVVAPIRYKPGLRCVVRLDAGTGEDRATLFGKTFSEGSAALVATVEALHRSSTRDERMPRVARPIAHLADLHLVLQPAVDGREIHAVAFAPTSPERGRSRIVGEAGAALAGFHVAADAPGPVRTIEDDLAELGGCEGAVAHAAPELHAPYRSLVEEVRGAASGLSLAPTVPSHGAFRTDQLLEDDDGLIMIDLDGFCRSSAGRDIGNFLAYLRWRALRQPDLVGFVATSRDAFLLGYGSVRSLPSRREIDVFEAASLIKIAGRRFRNLSVREWPLVPELLDAAAELLAD